MDPALHDSLFVFRSPLVDRLEELVVESATSGNKHFKLLVGPRGVGKTRVLSVLHRRLAAREDLSEPLVIAWLEENPWRLTTATQLFVALAETLAEGGVASDVEPKLLRLQEIPRAQQESYARQVALESVGDRTLLVLIENFDEVLEALGDAGQKALRSFLQEGRRCCIVATARTLSRELTDRESPFHGFFGVEPLSPLSDAAAHELLVRIGKAQQDEELVEALGTHWGSERVRFLNRLAEGNPRFFVIFSELLTAEDLGELIGPLLRTLDELLPYYHELMMSVSRQQRMIVAYLCDRDGPAPVKVIARECFITEQTASSQLRELKERELVEDLRQGRETYYDVREPLMRLVLQRRRSDRDPRRELIRFMKAWFGSASTDPAEQPMPSAEGKSTPPSSPEKRASRVVDATSPSPADSAERPRLPVASAPNEWAHDISAEMIDFHWQLGESGRSSIYEAMLRQVEVLRQPPFGAEARALWNDLWQSAGAECRELALPLRLLDAAVRYLESEDRRPLIELTRLEREPVAELLGLDPQTLAPPSE